MIINRDNLVTAWEELRKLPFPSHPDDPDLADWLLDLAELDGHIAGQAVTALGTGRPEIIVSDGVSTLASRLADIHVVGEDDNIYEAASKYLTALKRVEDALSGRESKEY